MNGLCKGRSGALFVVVRILRVVFNRLSHFPKFLESVLGFWESAVLESRSLGNDIVGKLY